MKEAPLTSTEEYLLSQRGRNNRDIARVLRKYIRHYITRDQIPLGIMHPDYLLEDLHTIRFIANRILAQIDDQPYYKPIKQAEITFGDKQ